MSEQIDGKEMNCCVDPLRNADLRSQVSGPGATEQAEALASRVMVIPSTRQYPHSPFVSTGACSITANPVPSKLIRPVFYMRLRHN
jgi:hypothetical protein